jgi:hypothetical protein
LRLRAICTFEYLTEQETEAGFAAMDIAVAAEQIPQPVEEDCDLLVMAQDPRKPTRATAEVAGVGLRQIAS